MTDTFLEADGSGLSDLMDLAVEAEALWHAEDLPDIWRHQLACQLPPLVLQRRAAAAGLLAEDAGMTFGELLSQPKPSLAVLQDAFAVAADPAAGIDQSGGAPAGISRALRAALASAALLQTGRPFLARSELACEIDWASSQPWLDEATRDLVTEALVASRAATGLPPDPSANSADDGEIFPIFPGYEILGRLGEGGMGVVWRARQLTTGRVVALKTVRGGAFVSERARLRFGREVELASQLEHPNIARVYDSGVFHGARFYAMELVEGLPLDQYVTSNKLARADIVALMAQVCRAMQYAHERGVIHRDVKPSNIMVDGEGRPRVLDFGLAKTDARADGEDGRLSLQLSLDGQLAGTVAYMAPEQARGESFDTRGDVYALGAVLLHLLSGKLAHEQAGTTWDVLRRVASEPAARPRQLDASIDSELEAVLLKAIAFDPGQRYASAGELVADIERYLRGEPLLARPPTLAYFAGRWVSRRRAPLAIATAVALALLGTVAWSYVRVALARNDAVAAQAREQGARVLAEQHKAAAESARRDADRSAAQALADRRRAEQAARDARQRLGDSLIAEGDAMAEASRWVEAKRLYRQARDDLQTLGESAEDADLALVPAYRVAPPPLMRFCSRHGAVLATAISADKRVAASGGGDGTITLWDARSGRALCDLSGRREEVTTLAFSPDGDLLLSGWKDGWVRIWSCPGGKCLHEMKLAGGLVCGANFSADGKLCWVADELDDSRVWDVRSGREIARPKLGAIPSAIALSPDHKLLLIVGAGGFIHTYNYPDPDSHAPQEITCYPGIGAAAFAPDGRHLLAGRMMRPGFTQTLTWFDTQTWQGVDLIGHGDAVTAVAVGPHGNIGYSASLDGTIKTWDLGRLAEVFTTWGDGKPLENACISRDDTLALSGGVDGVMMLWDLNGDAGVISGQCQNATHSAAVSPDGRLALIGGDPFLTLVDLETGTLLARAKLNRITGTAISPDDVKGLYIKLDDGAYVCNLADLSPTVRGLRIRPKFWSTRGASFSSDGRRVLVADGSDVGVCDPNTGRSLLQFHSRWTLEPGICFSGDESLILAVTGHGVAEAWDSRTGLPMPRLGWFQDRRELDYESNVSFTSDGKVAVASASGRVLVWDALTGRLIAREQAHRGSVLSTALSPDDRWLVTTGSEGAVKLWSLQPLRELRTLLKADEPMYSTRFSADGRRLVAFNGGKEGRFTVLDLDRPARYRAFQARFEQLQSRPADDPEYLELLGEWYAFRGQWAWAADFLRSARAAGRDVSPLLLARSLWMSGSLDEARKEFQAAKSRHEAPGAYIELCLSALAGRHP